MKAVTSVVSVERDNFDIEKFVNEATWKDILVELVKKNELNPWDIDIIDIVERYIEVVKGLKVLDLRVPANIILAASILLRLKSEMLELNDSVEEEQAVGDFSDRPFVQVEGLSVRLRLPPRRRVTLTELIGALEEVMKLKEYREAEIAEQNTKVPLTLSRVDVEADVEVLYSVIKKNKDRSNMLTFSSLCSVSQRSDALLDVFIPLLFLASKKRILLIQDSFFEEIVIALN